MIKTLQKIMKQDKERFVVAKGVQQAIPIRAIWPEGIFQVGNKFSRTFRFADINYAVGLQGGQGSHDSLLFGVFEFL